ncbi:ABC transporter ATP-binding protein [Myxococcota bacterium]|nr:ABC transporter ATP-binding protein [Myxococcota bacterium]
MFDEKPTPVLQLIGATKHYATPAGPFAALESVDVEIARGRFVAVTGKSGSGKSTLLHLVAGIDRPTSGSILVDGTAIEALDESRLAAWRGRNVGVVFQSFQLLPTLTIAENVMLPIDFAGRLRARALALLDEVGIRDQADKLPSALSGGQQQRAAIARALANDPPLVVADEPTGNLDSRTAALVLELLRGLTRRGTTVVMVTHDEQLAAQVDEVIALVDGRVVEPPRASIAKSAAPALEVARG